MNNGQVHVCGWPNPLQRSSSFMVQWRSQDEQVTWAQRGHTQCVRNMHLLGNLGRAPTMKFFFLL